MVQLRLGQDQVMEVRTPYFIKAVPKTRRRKRRVSGGGAYLGLEALGLIERCSLVLPSEVVENARIIFTIVIRSMGHHAKQPHHSDGKTYSISRRSSGSHE